MKQNRKVRLLIIPIISFLLLTILLGNRIFASELADWEFLPLGDNYLSDDNFTFTEGAAINQGTISTINYIRVKENTKYYLYFYCYQEGRFKGANITAYDSNKETLGVIDATFSLDNTRITFDAPTNCKYIKMEVMVEEDWGCQLNLMYVEENYILSDHEIDINNTTLSDMKYKGPNIDYSPVVSGNNGYYITNVDDPITLPELLSGIKAYDDNDGDVTDRIVVTKDDYSSNKKSVGVWEIVLQVSDSASNTTTFTIYVSVIDTEKPVITGKTSFKVETIDNYDVSHFFKELKIIDNYDGNISSEVKIISDEYTKNKNKAGTYKVTCYVSDSSNNRLDFTFTVVVEYIDRTAPVFSGKFTYDVNKSDVLKVETILKNVTATDNVDGDISKKIKVLKDYYSHAPSRVGTFKIVLSVSDTSGNTATQEIIINVKDNINPKFYIDSKVITIDLKDNKLTVNDLVNFLIKTNGLKEDINYNVTYDDYSENKNKPGEYRIVLEVDNKPFALTVNVLEKREEEKKTFIKKVLEFFNNLFFRIRGFFKRIF